MDDGDGDAGVTGGRSQRDTESVRYKRLETSLCTDLDQGTAAVRANLNRHKALENKKRGTQI